MCPSCFQGSFFTIIVTSGLTLEGSHLENLLLGSTFGACSCWYYTRENNNRGHHVVCWFIIPSGKSTNGGPVGIKLSAKNNRESCAQKAGVRIGTKHAIHENLYMLYDLISEIEVKTPDRRANGRSKAFCLLSLSGFIPKWVVKAELLLGGGSLLLPFHSRRSQQQKANEYPTVCYKLWN